MFTLSDEDIEYFSSRKDDFGNPYALPKRCPKCRKAKRERNQERERRERGE